MSLRPQVLLTLMLAFGFALGSPGASDPARSFAPSVEPGERTEYFILRFPLPAIAEAEEGEEALEQPMALAEWRRRKADGGWQLELDVRFPGAEIRVYAVECLSALGPRLVWREVSAGAGRTVLAEWTKKGASIRTLEWGRDGSLRENVQTEGGAIMPLYLAELARMERLNSGSQLVFDPLARQLVKQTIRTSYRAERSSDQQPAPAVDSPEPTAAAGAPAVRFLRNVELFREDGSLAARYVFRGQELLSFEWQQGGWQAERVDAAEYRREYERIDAERRQERAGLRSGAVKDL